MNRTSRTGRSTALILSLTFSALPACHHDTPADPSHPAAATSDQPVDLDRPLGYWRTGHKAEAFDALRTTNWANPRSDFTSPALRMTPEQFKTLPRAQKDAIRDQSISLANDIGALGRSAVSETAVLINAGNKPDAVALLHAVEAFGNRLAEPGRHLEVFRTAGEAIRQSAEQRLAEIR